jgi:hypothetical protein
MEFTGMRYCLSYSVRILVAVFASLMLLTPAFAGPNSNSGNKLVNDTTSSMNSLAVDFNESSHLIFMREEEKLARDVYITLGIKYPQLAVFGNISKSEETHTCAVCDKLTRYGIEDPVVNDNVGVFSGEEFGGYFSEKYQQLVEMGSGDELAALFVGALIEELDMQDINYCPEAIVKADNGINDSNSCGKVYTDNDDILRLYEALLEGSKDHLRAYVNNIEQRLGYNSYKAQILSQEEVDEILGR